MVAFVRRGLDPGEHVVVACNFTPVVQHGYRIGVPEACYYQEILNSDDTRFGGSGVTNGGGRHAIPMPWQNQPNHVELTLPPLGVVYLKPQR